MKNFFQKLSPIGWLLFLMIILTSETYVAGLYEAERIHATKSLAMAVYDTTAAPKYKGEMRMRISGGDTTFFISNGRAAGKRRWNVLQGNATTKITDAMITNWNTYVYLVNGTGSLDSLLYPVNDSTYRIKRVRVVGANGITVTPTIDAQSILYTVSVNGFNYQMADSVATSNATPTTLKTFTITDNSVGTLIVNMSAGKADGSGGVTGIKAVRYKKVSGTLTLGTISGWLSDEVDAAVSGATWTITTSSNNIIVQVTGVAATDIQWKTVSSLNPKIPVLP